jgi:carbon-monoxide dehydrogenase medium subunit
MSASKLPPFEYHEPATAAEATALLAAYGDHARVLAGGVDLLPRMRAGSVAAGHLVNIQRVAGLDYLRRTATGGIEFGSMASLHSLERWDELVRGYPALYEAIHQITSVQTKCMGTAVGNLCVATPASDVAPALAAYDAELLISGPGGERRVAMADFYPAYGRTALGPGEFVTGVVLPPVPEGQGAAFKNLVRTHADIAKVTVTAAVVLEGGICKQARIALGSVAPTMFRARTAEALLEGAALTDGSVLSAAAAAAAEAAPIDDIRSTAEYRKATTEVLVGRALHKAGERARGVAK